MLLSFLFLSIQHFLPWYLKVSEDRIWFHCSLFSNPLSLKLRFYVTTFFFWANEALHLVLLVTLLAGAAEKPQQSKWQMQLKVTWGRCLASAMAKDLYHLPNEISLPENIFLNLKLDEIISMDIYMCIYSKVDLISNVIQLLNYKHSHLYDLWIPELRWNLIFLNKKNKR